MPGRFLNGRWINDEGPPQGPGEFGVGELDLPGALESLNTPKPDYGLPAMAEVPAPPPPPSPPKMQLSDPVSPPRDVVPAEQQKAYEAIQALHGDAGPAPESQDDTAGRVAGLENLRGRLGLAKALGQGGNAIARGFMTMGRVPQNVSTGNDLSGIDEAQGVVSQDLARARNQIPPALAQRLGIGGTTMPGGLTFDQFAKIGPTLTGEANRKAANTREGTRQKEAEGKEARQRLGTAIDTFMKENKPLREGATKAGAALKQISNPHPDYTAVSIAATNILRAAGDNKISNQDFARVLGYPGIIGWLETMASKDIKGEAPPEVIERLRGVATKAQEYFDSEFKNAKVHHATRFRTVAGVGGGIPVSDDEIMTGFEAAQ